MGIEVKVYNESQQAHVLETFVLEDNQINLIAEIGDLIDTGQSMHEVKKRILKYRKDAVTVTLHCDWPNMPS